MNFKILVLIAYFLIFSAGPVFSAEDKFYNYYENGLEYMKKGDYNRAIVEFKSAYSLEFEDTKRKRTYGTKFIQYFPHRETGICHYYLEEYDNAKQELELSLSYKRSDRTEEFLNKISEGITQQKEKNEKELRELEEKKRKLAEEKKRIEDERLRKEKERAEKERIQEEERKALALKKKQEEEELEKKRLAEEQKRKEEEERIRKEKEALALNELEAERKKEEEKRLEDERRKLQEDQEKKAFALKQEIERLEKEKAEKERMEAERRRIEEEKKQREALAVQKEQEALAEQIAELERRRSELENTNMKASVPLTAEPVKVNRVGSPLAVAIIPIITEEGEDSHIPNMIMEKFITNLVKKRRFKVIEREFLDKIIEEQSLGMTGILDEQSAIEAGKVIGAEAIIMAKYNEVEGFYHLSTRVIDVETSETITASEITTRVSEIDRNTEKLSTMIVKEMPLFEGTVIKVEDQQVYLDIGNDLGVRKGNKFTVYRKGNEIKHPVSGEIMGYNVTPLGEAVAINIQERMSIAKIVKEGSINVGDKAVIK